MKKMKAYFGKGKVLGWAQINVSGRLNNGFQFVWKINSVLIYIWLFAQYKSFIKQKLIILYPENVKLMSDSIALVTSKYMMIFED